MGEDGALILNALRLHYKSVRSLSAKISGIRKLALSRIRLTHELQAYSHVPEVVAFAAKNAYEQTQFLRSQKKNPTLAHDVLDALRGVEVIPHNFKEFALTRDETMACKQLAEDAQIKKNDHVVIIAHASHILCNAVYNLEHAAEINMSLLACCLMLVSGRRLAEMLNGKSTFVPVSRSTVSFDGQLKKRHECGEYTIPLLVDSDLFVRAFKTLRTRQLALTPDLCQLSNVQVTAKYQGNLARQLKESFNAFHHIHVLRSFYASAVFEAYTVNATFARCAMQCLGHETLQESLSYNNVVLRDFETHRGTMGDLEW